MTKKKSKVSAITTTFVKNRDGFKKIKQEVVHHYNKRKHIEPYLPEWKRAFLEFNHRHLHWLERFVEIALPWLVLLLLFIIVAEFGQEIAGMLNHDGNIAGLFNYIGGLAHKYHNKILAIDRVIIVFFVMDLYFNFFKKATLWRFLKTYFLDILAITPIGFFAGFAAREIGGVQAATHVAVETERIAAEAVKGERIVTEVVKGERIAAEAVKGERVAARMPRLLRAAGRLPRLLRLYRIFDLFVTRKHSANVKGSKVKTVKKG